MASKTHGHTTRFYWDVDGVDPYTAVADLKAITPPKKTRGDTNITHLDSPNRYKEFMGTALKEGGEPVLRLFLGKAELANLDTHFENGTTLFGRVTLPLIGSESNPTKWEFSFYVKGLEPEEIDADSDDAVMATCTVKVTGKPTLTQGS